MNSIAFNFKKISELESFLSLPENKGNFTLGITFNSPLINSIEIVNVFNKFNIDLIGCTSAGEISNDLFIEDSCSVVLMQIAKSKYKIISKKCEGVDYTSEAATLGKEAKNIFSNPSIVFYASGVGLNGESVLDGIKQSFPENTIIFGGIAADYLNFHGIKSYSNEGVNENGICSIVFDGDKIKITGMSFSGWNELGKDHTITKSKGNVIYEVDDKPALDLFNLYFTNIEYKQNDSNEKLFTIPSVYPLKIKDKENIELLRAILMYDFENKSLILGGGVDEGQEFKFCPSPDFNVVEQTVEKFREFANTNSSPEVVIMDSCICRSFAFGPMMKDEIKNIYKIWNKPMAGLLTFGEIGAFSDGESCKFHNATCSLFTISEI
jgi:hypothetical protein